MSGVHFVEPASLASPEDAELEELLRQAYVLGGFTDPEQAPTLFAAPAVRARGELLVARAAGDRRLVGMVIVVPPSSPGRRLAERDEAEMQLLAVSPEHQGRGIGRLLIAEAIALAKRLGNSKMVLWTQPTMLAAHRLYSSAGFARAPARDFQRADGRSFLVFTRDL